MTAIEDANRALVIEAFDTLFNRRDYSAAEAFWSPDYIQHSAHIAPGRTGLFEILGYGGLLAGTVLLLRVAAAVARDGTT